MSVDRSAVECSRIVRRKSRVFPMWMYFRDSGVVLVNSSSAYTPFVNLGLYSIASNALLSMAKNLSVDPSVLPVRYVHLSHSPLPSFLPE